MPFVHARPQRHLTVVASVLIMASVASPALAGPRAPIVYANEKAASPARTEQATQLLGTDKATQRIAFRYPGSEARVEMASVTALNPASPVFEASRTEAPQFAPLTQSFDAANTAAQIGAGAGGLVVETVALQPVISAVPAPVATSPGSSFVETGTAIVYEDVFAGLPTANGEIFNQAAMTAAHPSLPLPSMVQVSNPSTGKTVMVRVNDRGPFEDGASFQVSRQVAVALGFERAGKAQLTFSAVSDAPVASYTPRRELKAEVLAQQPAVVKTQAAAVTPAIQPVQSDELLGGDELAGGTSWSATPSTQAKAREPVKWPEPPADWDVAPAVTKIAASASGTHFVQLASFSDIGNAETLYRGLQGDLPVEIVPARVNGTDYFRVRIGPLANRETAQQLRDRLNAEGKGDGRVVSAE